MTDKPKLLVTRKLPYNVEVRAGRRYDCHFNADDRPYSAEQLIQHATHHDAILSATRKRLPPKSSPACRPASR